MGRRKTRDNELDGRSEKHMNGILSQLKDMWKKYPHQRLLQLIANAICYGNIFYIEDVDLIKGLKEFDKKTNESLNKKKKRISKKDKNKYSEAINTLEEINKKFSKKRRRRRVRRHIH